MLRKQLTDITTYWNAFSAIFGSIGSIGSSGSYGFIKFDKMGTLQLAILALLLLLTINKVPDVGICRRKAMTGLGSPHLDIGESVRISILHSPFSDSIKLDFKEML